ncbi:MAG: FHA domain-containing protein [Planctomycetes bacterium]|nr:FHA domain-containing protein [Planctomycetota bacterium]
MARTLADWSNEAHRCSRDEFLRRHRGAFLVALEPPPSSDAPSFLVTTGKLPRVSWGQTVAPSGAAPSATSWSGARVHPVEKRPGPTPFPTMVTIGRAANNDIVLPWPGVSAFHAYLAREGEEWVLRDANSSHGTYLADVRVVAPTPLPADATLRFGDVRARFVDASNLLRLALHG